MSGARNLEECLLLQLTPETPHRDILRVLILNHLEDIRHNRLPAIQKRTGFDLHAIKEAIELHIESLWEHGESVPVPHSFVEKIGV